MDCEFPPERDLDPLLVTSDFTALLQETRIKCLSRKRSQGNSLVVQWSSGFHCQGSGLIQGTEIVKSHATRPKKKKKVRNGVRVLYALLLCINSYFLSVVVVVFTFFLICCFERGILKHDRVSVPLLHNSVPPCYIPLYAVDVSLTQSFSS